MLVAPRRHRHRNHRKLPAIAGLAVVALAGLPLTTGASAQTTTPMAAYSGSATANGLAVTTVVRGLPLTDTPLDGGGPTAQASGDSIGTSVGYAAFPDVGEFVLSLPGLVAGLVNAGAAGLPPIPLPTLPDYPLYVRSENPFMPDAQLGSGPYELKAHSGDDASNASATVGLDLEAVGHLALIQSTANVGRTEDGGAVAEAVSSIEGLTVGPLSIGKITSIARKTMSPSGAIQTETSVAIDAVRVGGIAVSLTGDGLDIAGIKIPLPINDLLQGLLGPLGITLEFLTAQEFPDRVVAPALRLSVPFETPNIPNVGQFDGSITVILGAATAELTGAAVPSRPPTTTPVTTPTTSGSGSTGGGSSTPPRSTGGGSTGSGSGSTGSTPRTSTGSGLPPTNAGSTGGTGGGEDLAGGEAIDPVPTSALLPAVDVSSVYLVLALGAIAIAVAGITIRRTGVNP